MTPYTSHNVDIGKLYSGMVRLSIIDIDGGRQPFRDEENELYFNGEIYNYLELKEEMQREGISFNTESDGEVLFKGLVRHGWSYLNKIDGMFALSWYRIKEQTLGLARDKHGEKPLFYYHEKKMFRYGSELALVDDEYRLDEMSVRSIYPMDFI